MEKQLNIQVSQKRGNIEQILPPAISTSMDKL
jgi:hypothetical protein